MNAIILAGGKGTRLKSVVADLPKPMADINGTRGAIRYSMEYTNSNDILVLNGDTFFYQIVESFEEKCFKASTGFH